MRPQYFERPAHLHGLSVEQLAHQLLAILEQEPLHAEYHSPGCECLKVEKRVISDGVTQNIWTCPICCFTLKSAPAERKRHVYTHVNPQDRPYHCSYEGCDYTAVQAKNLQSHCGQYGHGGEPLPPCGALFKHGDKYYACSDVIKTYYSLHDHRQEYHQSHSGFRVGFRAGKGREVHDAVDVHWLPAQALKQIKGHQAFKGVGDFRESIGKNRRAPPRRGRPPQSRPRQRRKIACNPSSKVSPELPPSCSPLASPASSSTISPTPSPSTSFLSSPPPSDTSSSLAAYAYSSSILPVTMESQSVYAAQQHSSACFPGPNDTPAVPAMSDDVQVYMATWPPSRDPAPEPPAPTPCDFVGSTKYQGTIPYRQHIFEPVEPAGFQGSGRVESEKGLSVRYAPY